jgi:F0F1-type ATP synthase beta subunit
MADKRGLDLAVQAHIYVSLQETLQDVQRILDGTEDHKEAKELMFIGHLH